MTSPLVHTWDRRKCETAVLLARCIDRCQTLVFGLRNLCMKEVCIPTKRVPLQSMEAGAPMQIVAVDILGLGPLPETPLVTATSWLLWII